MFFISIDVLPFAIVIVLSHYVQIRSSMQLYAVAGSAFLFVQLFNLLLLIYYSKSTSL